LVADGTKSSPSLATLTSPVISGGAQCLQFYYHASGVDQRNLRLAVFIKVGNTNNLLWSHSGDEGNQWNKAMIDLPAGKNNYQVKCYVYLCLISLVSN